MTAETLLAVPVKGTVWQHPTKTTWNRDPLVLTVTSVTRFRGTLHVYSKDQYGSRGSRVSLDVWRERAILLSTPEPAERVRAVRLTDAQCAELWARAHAAGMAAGEAVRPTPMVVFQRANPLDDNSPITKVYEPVMDGACGFAQVRVRPGTCTFARWMRKTGLGRTGYYGGTDYWVSAFGQSVERKGAFAAAAAGVLTEAGVTAYSASQLD